MLTQKKLRLRADSVRLAIATLSCNKPSCNKLSCNKLSRTSSRGRRVRSPEGIAMMTAPGPSPRPGSTTRPLADDQGRPAQPGARGWRARVPAWAGIAYVAAWVAGLAAWPANLALNATSAQVAAAHRAHVAGAATQYLLVEGLD